MPSGKGQEANFLAARDTFNTLRGSCKHHSNDTSNSNGSNSNTINNDDGHTTINSSHGNNTKAIITSIKLHGRCRGAGAGGAAGAHPRRLQRPAVLLTVTIA